MIGVSLRSPRLGYYGSPTSVRDVGEEHHHDGDVLQEGHLVHTERRTQGACRLVFYQLDSVRAWLEQHEQPHKPALSVRPYVRQIKRGQKPITTVGWT
jgi:hypothetical protein